MTITIRKGETLQLQFQADDETAETVQLLVADSEGNNIIDETESFSTVDGLRVATLTTNDTNHDVGEYEYMLVVTYEDGFIKKYPQADECEGDDCTLPPFIICETL